MCGCDNLTGANQAMHMFTNIRGSTYLNTEINNGHVCIVKFVQNICFTKIQLFKLNMVDHRVRDATTGQFYIIICLFSFRIVLAFMQVYHTCHVQLWSGPVGNRGFAYNYTALGNVIRNYAMLSGTKLFFGNN